MKIKLINHPLVQHKVTLLRDKRTKPKQFRELLKELSILMIYEITADLTLSDQVVETPMASYSGKILQEEIVLLPIFRAGLGMVEGFLTVIPTARVGHLGIYRNEDTFDPVFYYSKLPDLTN
ncbi:MAG TPA: uracil phosphoribosyltransferase, partial [Firmicutes bacterium]|nr:uracil phosphoribosyltransferase [Bacillota bacterium]